MTRVEDAQKGWMLSKNVRFGADDRRRRGAASEAT
jgi:hypothetical protein